MKRLFNATITVTYEVEINEADNDPISSATVEISDTMYDLKGKVGSNIQDFYIEDVEEV